MNPFQEDLARKETILQHIQREQAIKDELAGNEATRKKRAANKKKKAVQTAGPETRNSET